MLLTRSCSSNLHNTEDRHSRVSKAAVMEVWGRKEEEAALGRRVAAVVKVDQLKMVRLSLQELSQNL